MAIYSDFSKFDYTDEIFAEDEFDNPHFAASSHQTQQQLVQPIPCVISLLSEHLSEHHAPDELWKKNNEHESVAQRVISPLPVSRAPQRVVTALPARHAHYEAWKTSSELFHAAQERGDKAGMLWLSQLVLKDRSQALIKDRKLDSKGCLIPVMKGTPSKRESTSLKDFEEIEIRFWI